MSSYLACVSLWQDLSNGNNFEHVTLTVTVDLFLKNYDMGLNFFILRNRAFIQCIWHVCSLWQELSDGTLNFEHVTLNVTFDLLLKNFNTGHNFFILRDWVFYIWHMCSLWQGLSNGTIKIELATSDVLKKKTYNHGLNFSVLSDGGFIFAYVFLMTRPFRQYHIFWTCDLDRNLWPTFEHWQ